MRLPRWTTYPALAVLGSFLVTAVPMRGLPPWHGAGAALRTAPITLPEARHPRLVILGIDGLDPDILATLVREQPERVPNFARLAETGSGIRELGTSTPPQSPVAWSNFITGRNPGGHGIYDFIHRNPANYEVLPSTVTVEEGKTIPLPGEWEFPLPAGGDSNRSGKAFWTVLGEHGVPADVWRMPINFPVEKGRGWSFSGMMTPAIDSAYGECSFYSTNLPVQLFGDEKCIAVQVSEGRILTQLKGPEIPFKEPDPKTHHKPRAIAPMTIYVDEENGGAAIDLDGKILVLRPGEWSDFTEVSFRLLPMGMMDMAGIVRFYLRSISPEFELYASPVNVDPKDPVNPVSEPEDASDEVAEAVGDYYTQGMPEDVNALKKKVLTDAEFMQQAKLCHDESDRMLDYALDRYTQSDEGGLLFFYYSTVDLCCHMMWRHADGEHPFHDEALAREDSSWFTGREGSTWGEQIVYDLYAKMDEALGAIRSRIGPETPIIVMSDHGFAPYRRKFSLNTWLLENGYMVLNEGRSKEQPGAPAKVFISDAVDWSKTKAYGMGFNGLYLNLVGREAQGIVQPGAEADALLGELKRKLEAVRDDAHWGGAQVVLVADLATTVYDGERSKEAPDIVVGYNSGYGNSDEASQGRITEAVLSDNLGGTFNGSHLMHPSVVQGTLLTNLKVMNPHPKLEDMTVEVLRIYGLAPEPGMVGEQVLE